MSENSAQDFSEFLRTHVELHHIAAPVVPAPDDPRPLHVIADEIRADWSTMGRGVSPYAVPYLDAMSCLEGVRDNYGADSAASIVRYFLANANTWRGETARRIKGELNKMIKGVY